jgi:Tfp pilus assembly protein PilO
MFYVIFSLIFVICLGTIFYQSNTINKLDKVNEELMEENLALRESFRQFKEKEINIETFKE